jgi:hypothetical protein
LRTLFLSQFWNSEVFSRNKIVCHQTVIAGMLQTPDNVAHRS